MSAYRSYAPGSLSHVSVWSDVESVEAIADAPPAVSHKASAVEWNRQSSAAGSRKTLVQTLDDGLQRQVDRIEMALQGHTQTLSRRMQEMEMRLLNAGRSRGASVEASSYHGESSEGPSTVKNISEKLPSPPDELARSSSKGVTKLHHNSHSERQLHHNSHGERQLHHNSHSDRQLHHNSLGERSRFARSIPAPPTRTSALCLSQKFVLGKVWQDDIDVLAFEDSADMGWYNSGQRDTSIATANGDAPRMRLRFMLRPSSGTRLAWDLTGLLLIFWDIVSIPFVLAFDPPDSPLTISMFWLVLGFWTMDIMLSFNTGVYKHGMEVLDRTYAIRAYARTWMLPDFLVVGLDWLSIILGSVDEASGVSEASRSVRAVKAIRAVRLLRLMKLRRIVDAIQGHLMSEPMNIAMKMGKLTFIVLLLNHIVACSWWAIGKMNDSEGFGGWAKELIQQDRNVVYRYATSLHWSLTQFTPASMEVIAGNTAERLFTVVVLIFALLVFSSFLSSITAAMTELRYLSTAADKNLSMLRRFLKSHVIHTYLTHRIMRYVEHKLKQQRHQIQASDVVLLRMLSQPLHDELMKEIYQPTLSRHPFFRCLGRANDSAIQQVCNHAVIVVSLSVNDTLFTGYSKGYRMFIVRSGRLEYEPTHRLDHFESSRDTRSPLSTIISRMSSNVALSVRERIVRRRLFLCGETTLNPGDFCTEGALWTSSWVHLGTTNATEVSEVLALEATRFADAIALHHKAFGCAVRYSRLFVAHLNEVCGQGRATDLGRTDINLIDTMATEAFCNVPNLRSVEASQESWWSGQIYRRLNRQQQEKLAETSHVESAPKRSLRTSSASGISERDGALDVMQLPTISGSMPMPLSPTEVRTHADLWAGQQDVGRGPELLPLSRTASTEDPGWECVV